MNKTTSNQNVASVLQRCCYSIPNRAIKFKHRRSFLYTNYEFKINWFFNYGDELWISFNEHEETNQDERICMVIKNAESKNAINPLISIFMRYTSLATKNTNQITHMTWFSIFIHHTTSWRGDHASNLIVATLAATIQRSAHHNYIFTPKINGAQQIRFGICF